MGVDGYNVADATLQVSRTLPGTATTLYSSGIDLGAMGSIRGARLANCELLINAPAMTVGEMANGDTMTYKLQMDNDSAFGSPTTLADGVIVQTGAGGVGCAAATFRMKIPTNCERYVRLAATAGTSGGDASTATATLKLLF